MPHSVTVEEARTLDDLKQVQAFAQSFEHVVTGNHPVRLVSVDGEPCGYVELIRYPLLNTGWKHGMPKHVLAGIRQLKSWSEVQYGGSCIAVDPTSGIAPHLEKLGFINTQHIIYRS
jgi:hypothetical protein